MATTEVQEKGTDPTRRDATSAPPTAASDQPTIDWTGRSAVGGSDDRDGAGPAVGTDGGSGTRRLAVVAGVVSAAYVAWIVIDLVVLSTSGSAYTSMHRALGSLGGRVVLSVAWLAVLYHGLDGLRVVLTDFVPRLAPRQRLLRGIVGFVLFATWIPTALIIVWPSVRRWFAA